jgi:hypothetical protein
MELYTLELLVQTLAGHTLENQTSFIYPFLIIDFILPQGSDILEILFGIPFTILDTASWAGGWD